MTLYQPIIRPYSETIQMIFEEDDFKEMNNKINWQNFTFKYEKPKTDFKLDLTIDNWINVTTSINGYGVKLHDLKKPIYIQFRIINKDYIIQKLEKFALTKSKKEQLENIKQWKTIKVTPLIKISSNNYIQTQVKTWQNGVLTEPMYKNYGYGFVFKNGSIGTALTFQKEELFEQTNLFYKKLSEIILQVIAKNNTTCVSTFKKSDDDEDRYRDLLYKIEYESKDGEPKIQNKIDIKFKPIKEEKLEDFRRSVQIKDYQIVEYDPNKQYSKDVNEFMKLCESQPTGYTKTKYQLKIKKQLQPKLGYEKVQIIAMDEASMVDLLCQKTNKTNITYIAEPNIRMFCTNTTAKANHTISAKINCMILELFDYEEIGNCVNYIDESSYTTDKSLSSSQEKSAEDEDS